MVRTGIRRESEEPYLPRLSTYFLLISVSMASSEPDINLDDIQVLFMRLISTRLAKLDLHEEQDDSSGDFSEPVTAFQYPRSSPLVVLVLDDNDRIIRAAVGYRGYSGGTDLSQVSLSHNTRVAEVSIAQTLEKVQKRFQQWVRSAIKSNGLLSPGASKALLTVLATDDTDLASVIRSAKLKQLNPLSKLSPSHQLRMQQERDAGFTAMLIAGIQREAIIEHAVESIESNDWFLDKVIDVRLREDPMAMNDAMTFPGFTLIRQHVSGAFRLQQDRTQLSIFLINRQPLEQLTGTDLIYLNEAFSSFVMVQYKAMEREGNIDVFRFPNTQLTEEMGRMLAMQKDLDAITSSSTLQGFRLNPRPFFLKFCPRLLQQPTEPDLVPGMYFPLDHWQLLEGDDSLRGSNGGMVLRFQQKSPVTNADRYLSNSDFASFVRGGWLGTTVCQSQILQQAIELTLSRGRSVTLASVQQTAARPEDNETDVV